MTESPASARLDRYDDAVAQFDIAKAIALLAGNPDTGINACIECCDRYTGENRVALRAISIDNTLTELTFEDLRDMSARVRQYAGRCRDQRRRCGCRSSPRTPELVATILGAWRIGAIYQPLFTAFWPKSHRTAFRHQWR